MLRVVMADDHAVVREGLKHIISESRDMTVAGEANGGAEAIEVVRRTPCDVLVLDLSMPDTSGMEVLRQIHSELPKLPVLILSMHAEDQYAVRVLRAGASGYLSKESAPDKLIEAIRKVTRGAKYVSAEVSEQLVFNIGKDSSQLPHELLSRREYQVLCMIASAKTVGNIATELKLSVKTISTYRARILEKLEMNTNADLTRYAIKSGLVV
jgi:two-component system, NarL family, invasion response regulator UvrY